VERIASAGYRTCELKLCWISTYEKELTKRDREQNIRVVASYYTQITLPRLTELLDLSAAEAERTLCRLVTEKVVRAKIDRSAGIVDFSPRSNPDEILNAWSGDLGKMLGLIEKTSHLINKVSSKDSMNGRAWLLTTYYLQEYAIHAARAAAAWATIDSICIP
jgi:hypothetical protein